MDDTLPKRLNPFAFPVETDTLFTLFVLGAFMWLLAWLPDAGSILSQMWSGRDVPIQEVASNFAWMLGIPVLFTGITIVLYLLYPVRIMRRQKLIKFTAETDPVLDRELQALTRRVQLRNPFSVMLRKTNQLDGQAFGLPRHYLLRLDEGLRLALRRAPQMMRAITLHEMAHFINRDVARTYFVQALWSALVILFFVPYLLILLLNWVLRPRLELAIQGGLTPAVLQRLLFTTLPSYLLIAFQFLLGLSIVLALRAAMLRAREHYADWRVVEWGEGDGLTGLFKISATPPSISWLSRLGASLHLHPTVTERLQVVQDPMRLFQGSMAMPFFVGWLSALSLAGLGLPYTSFLSWWSALTERWSVAFLQGLTGELQSLMIKVFLIVFLTTDIVLVMVPMLVLGYTIMGSVGNTVQRRAVADTFRNVRGWKPYLRLLGPGLLFVLGLYAGQATPFGGTMLGNLGVLGLALPGFVIGVWMCLCLIRFLSIRMLGAHIGSEPPHWKRRALSGFATLLLGLFLFVFFIVLLFSLSATNSEGQAIQIADPTSVVVMGMILLGTVVGGLCLWLGFLIGGFLALSVWRRVRPLRCPQCKSMLRETVVLGKTCPTCHAELTAWVLVSASLASNG